MLFKVLMNRAQRGTAATELIKESLS